MLLIGNGTLITNDPSNPYIENGGVVLEKGLVKEIGKVADLKKKYSNAEFIDAKGKIIMPGFINTHMHIYSAFARGMPGKGPAPKVLTDILKNLWWRIDKGLTLDDVKYSAYTTYLDCIRYGVTTTFDHHASPTAVTDSLFTIADVAKELNIRANVCYETSDRDGEKSFLAGVKENVDFIKHANNNDQDMVKGMFGMHASFTLSDKSMETCAKAMAGLNAGYHVHIAEGIEDLHHCLQTHGKRLADRFYDFDVLGDKTIGVHCIYLNEHEFSLLKDTNTNVVHNPESNMGNACGTSPVIRMMERGINVGLGTDGYTHDMLESVKVANIIHKHHLVDPNAAWGEVPKMLFENNRKIAKKYFSKDAGILKEGAFGDVILIDYEPHTPMNKDNYYSHILFGMMGKSVTDTIVGGKVVMRDREILVVDEKAILSKARELSKDLWKRIS